jgi:hypothetical protein
MTSPDVRSYVDLTLFDASSQAILQKALDYAIVALPEYEPREGSIETTMLESMALEVQEAIYAINRLPGAVTEVLLRLLDIERSDGVRATAVVRFTGQTTAGFTAPVGTRLIYQPDSISDFLLLETTEAATGTHAKPIQSATRASTTLTVVTTTRHGLSTGDQVSISGAGDALLNLSNQTIAVVDATTFTITVSSSGSASATTGTVTPALTIPATGFAAVRATTTTGAFNGLAGGTSLSLLSIVSQVDAAELETQLLGGSEPEDDSEYFTRASATLSRLSTSLATATQVGQYVAESGRYPDVYRVLAVDNTDGVRVGDLAGSIMVAVAPIDATPQNLSTGTGDGSLTSDDIGYGTKDEVYDGIAERLNASLDVTVVDPAIVTVQVDTTVKLPDGLSAESVQAACEDTLAGYLSPNTWPWTDTVRANEVAYALRQTTVTSGTVVQPACEYVESLTLTPTNAFVSSDSQRFEIDEVRRTGTTCQVNLSANHGITFDASAGETLWLKVGGTTTSSGAFNTATIVLATLADTDRFTYTQGSGLINPTPDSGYVLPIKRTAGGDLVIYDPAVLVLSDSHDITTA